MGSIGLSRVPSGRRHPRPAQWRPVMPSPHRRRQSQAGLDVDQQFAPILRALPTADLQADERVLTFRRGHTAKRLADHAPCDLHSQSLHPCVGDRVSASEADPRDPFIRPAAAVAPSLPDCPDSSLIRIDRPEYRATPQCTRSVTIFALKPNASSGGSGRKKKGARHRIADRFSGRRCATANGEVRAIPACLFGKLSVARLNSRIRLLPQFRQHLLILGDFPALFRDVDRDGCRLRPVLRHRA